MTDKQTDTKPESTESPTLEQASKDVPLKIRSAIKAGLNTHQTGKTFQDRSYVF